MPLYPRVLRKYQVSEEEGQREVYGAHLFDIYAETANQDEVSGLELASANNFSQLRIAESWLLLPGTRP